MHIDTLLNSVKQQAKSNINDITLSVPSSWEQGRTLYGGMSASLVYQAMRDVVDSEKVMRSLSTNFIGPIEADTEFSIIVEVLREGKNVTQVVGRIVQDNKVALMSQASFGIARQSIVNISDPLQHNMDYPQAPNFILQIPKVTPKFLGYFDLAQSKGGLPFTGKKDSDVHGWMRFKKPPNDSSDAHLIALIDIWPPTILQMLNSPAMASTLSWNLEFIHPHQKMSGGDWFAYQAHTRQAADGYAHTEANILDKHGSLVAISRQVVAVFA
ncbi:acyl-CoA thioesterase II [Paraglaciecola sp. MB-3u-78]|uniref:acyl-CoA thioesterase n=1 Tax=Paraglaciecola sp. MB-3u-78 TaxID=2058332 RepID=UPI000C3209F1|nr:thioesterase family protein [Paraglaciecola sp. MB-3u-78]PKG96021.1 thioesterase family protein [Paraglaciecola sp. MB-3u-78]